MARIVCIGTLPPGSLFEYSTLMSGKPYVAIGKVLCHIPLNETTGTPSHTQFENEHGNVTKVSTKFDVMIDSETPPV